MEIGRARVPRHPKSLKMHEFLSFFQKKWCWRWSFEVAIVFAVDAAAAVILFAADATTAVIMLATVRGNRGCGGCGGRCNHVRQTRQPPKPNEYSLGRHSRRHSRRQFPAQNPAQRAGPPQGRIQEPFFPLEEPYSETLLGNHEFPIICLYFCCQNHDFRGLPA